MDTAPDLKHIRPPGHHQVALMNQPAPFVAWNANQMLLTDTGQLHPQGPLVQGLAEARAHANACLFECAHENCLLTPFVEREADPRTLRFVRASPLGLRLRLELDPTDTVTLTVMHEGWLDIRNPQKPQLLTQLPAGEGPDPGLIAHPRMAVSEHPQEWWLYAGETTTKPLVRLRAPTPFHRVQDALDMAAICFASLADSVAKLRPWQLGMPLTSGARLSSLEIVFGLFWTDGRLLDDMEILNIEDMECENYEVRDILNEAVGVDSVLVATRIPHLRVTLSNPRCTLDLLAEDPQHDVPGPGGLTPPEVVAFYQWQHRWLTSITLSRHAHAIEQSALRPRLNLPHQHRPDV